jgi:hypothetical protein
MKLCNRRRVAVGLAVFALGLTANSSSADHAWGNYHWARKANPFTLRVGDNVDSKWDKFLNTAISDWSASTVLNLASAPGGTRPRRCRPTTGRIEACNASYGSTGWLGIAQIWASGSHITQAVTKLNDTYFNTATYNTPAWRQLVACQEIAHDFGLDHQDETFSNPNLGSCMDYTNDPDGGGAYGPSNLHPNSHDYDEVEIIYGHTDSTTTISATTTGCQGAGVDEGDLDHPSQWGQLVRSNRNGRVQIYERDLGRGNKIITHVFWAEPRADGRR